MGKVLAWSLPLAEWTIWPRVPFIGGWSFSLNPGPFNIKVRRREGNEKRTRRDEPLTASCLLPLLSSSSPTGTRSHRYDGQRLQCPSLRFASFRRERDLLQSSFPHRVSRISSHHVFLSLLGVRLNSPSFLFIRFEFLLVLSTQLTGLTLAGWTRRFLVRPFRVLPSSLSTSKTHSSLPLVFSDLACVSHLASSPHHLHDSQHPSR